jgi:hypothetical protein
MKSEIYERKVDTPDGLLARILDVAVRVKIREDLLRLVTLGLRTRFA